MTQTDATGGDPPAPAGHDFIDGSRRDVCMLPYEVCWELNVHMIVQMEAFSHVLSERLTILWPWEVALPY